MAYAKALKKPSTSQRRELEERRRHLQIRITNYEQHWSGLISFAGEAIDLEANHLLNEEDEDKDDEDDLGTADEWENNSDGFQPEAVTIFLPSNVSRENHLQHGLEDMAACEAKLRVGQMNDTLQQLRIALGEKSLIFREKV